MLLNSFEIDPVLAFYYAVTAIAMTVIATSIYCFYIGHKRTGVWWSVSGFVLIVTAFGMAVYRSDAIPLQWLLFWTTVCLFYVFAILNAHRRSKDFST